MSAERRFPIAMNPHTYAVWRRAHQLAEYTRWELQQQTKAIRASHKLVEHTRSELQQQTKAIRTSRASIERSRRLLDRLKRRKAIAEEPTRPARS